MFMSQRDGLERESRSLQHILGNLGDINERNRGWCSVWHERIGKEVEFENNNKNFYWMPAMILSAFLVLNCSVKIIPKGRECCCSCFADDETEVRASQGAQ